MLTTAWTTLSTGQAYRDPGADYYLRRQPDRGKAIALRTLHDLGYQVTLDPLTRPA